MQAVAVTTLDDHGKETDLLADDTFDAFAGVAASRRAPERPRTRRGGPRAPLPLLPLIGLCFGIGLAYVAQTAHLTQTSYQQTSLEAQQQQLQRQADSLGSDLARLRSPERIDAAAQRLGLKPPARWAYVAQVPAPIAAPVTTPLPGSADPSGAPPQHVVQAMVGQVGSGSGSGSLGRTP